MSRQQDGATVRRYVLTGAPGAGKTSILRALAGLGYATVGEAATAVIAEGQARGVDEPWETPLFLDEITDRQKRWQTAPVAPGMRVQVFDRSPICTYALATYLDRSVTPALADEIERVLEAGIYERQVFFVRNLGFCEPTAARRITFPEALRFEQIHEETYREFGFELIEIPAGPLDERVAAVDAAITGRAGE